MEIRIVGGRRATNRVGAAEYLDVPVNTVRMYSSPSRRAKTGWPEPLAERVDRQDWFALGDLDAYRQRTTVVGEAPPVDDPDRLIGTAEFAALRGVRKYTMKRYVELSLDAWEAGRDGYLPLPDQPSAGQPRPVGRGHTYRWRLGRAVAWSFPDAVQKSSGRPAGRRPDTKDLRRLLDEAAERGERPTSRQLAALLDAQFGQVTLQSVHRLKRRLRAEDAGTK